MTYKNIKTEETIDSKVGNKQDQQAFNSDGFSGGMINAQSIKLKTSTAEVLDLATSSPYYIGMSGACYDGKQYMYFHNRHSPSYGRDFLRFDTTLPYAIGALKNFNLTSLDASYIDFTGFVFDGRYVYMIPYNDVSRNGDIVRYDTTASFTAGGSYTAFDMTTVDANAKGYQTAVFDGRYIYLIPYNNGSAEHGLIVRYDTTADFNTIGSYDTFDLASINANYTGYLGGCSDGRYIYFYPHYNGAYHGNLVRYDTTQSFTSSASYEVVNLASFNADYVGFFGITFDGRYLYISTTATVANQTNDKIVRYDTTKEFSFSDSYTHFSTTDLDASITGARNMFFDGKYAYVFPYYNRTTTLNGTKIAVYNTHRDYSDSDSWYFFDLQDVDTDLEACASYVFTGEYLYILPFSGGGAYSGKIVKFKIKLYNTGD